MIIPMDKIPRSELRKLVEDFVSREGTDYGHKEYSLEEKVEGVLELLRNGSAVVSFDPDEETFTILSK